MKYAFITGAAGGIASAVVEELDKRGGWTIFAADISPLDEIDAKTSDNVIPVHIDITSQESCFEAADKVRETVDHLDAVCNIAGTHTMASLIEGDPATTLERIMNINLFGMVRVNKAMFPLVNACKGRIINYSSECGWMQPQPFNSPYAISKYAVEGYTIGLRRELKFIDIPVVKIQPGSFKSKMHGQANDGYVRLREKTELYSDVLGVMKPMMDIAFAHPHPMEKVVNATIEAMEVDHPRTNYKVGTDLYLAVIDPIPAKVIDFGYKAVIGLGATVMKKLGKL